MMITNWFGVFFCFVIPAIFINIALYFEGYEEGRKSNKKKRGVNNGRSLERH